MQPLEILEMTQKGRNNQSVFITKHTNITNIVVTFAHFKESTEEKERCLSIMRNR